MTKVADLKDHGLRCFLDLDGVLVDLLSGFVKHLGVPSPYEKKENLGNFNILRTLGDPPAPGQDAFDTLDHDFWANLAPTQDGKGIYATVESFFGPGNVCILSCPTRNPQSASGKVAWINQHYPQLSRTYFLGATKHFAAAPNNVLVDDSDYNVESFRKAGGKAILVPRPWNSLHDYKGEVFEWLTEALHTLE